MQSEPSWKTLQKGTSIFSKNHNVLNLVESYDIEVLVVTVSGAGSKDLLYECLVFGWKVSLEMLQR